MKKYMKKIIFAFSFALLFVGQSVFAAPFNTASNDCPTIGVGNVSTGSGVEDGHDLCWMLSSVQAKAGDNINVHIYYHNTSSSPATNVKISLNKNPSSGSSSTHSFSTTISSDQGSVSGNAQVYINSSQALNFTGASWQPNQSRTDATLPFGQNESQVMNGGINIGTVNPGWNTQGSVVVSFDVSSASVNPPNNNDDCQIDYFRVSDDDIEEGDRVTFSWDTSDCSYVTLTSFSERMDTNDSITARPTYSREYCLNAYGTEWS